MKNILKNKKIVMVSSSNLVNDTRILNEANVLATDYKVVILGKKRLSKDKVISQNFNTVLLKSNRYKKNKILNMAWFLYQLTKRAIKENPDIYHAHDADGLLCAFWAALIRRKKLVYDSHELWSEVTLQPKWRWLRPIYRFIERVGMIKVIGIITVNGSLAKILQKKYHKKTLVLYNYPTFSHSNSSFNIKKKYESKKVIIYVGNLSYGRGLNQLVEVSQLLPKDFLIVFLGSGILKESLLKNIQIQNLRDKVLLIDPVAPKDIIATIKGADLGISLIENVSKSYYYSSPNKLFQYIAAEIPVLGSNFPEFKKVILSDKIGQVVDPDKTKIIAGKIIEMVKPINQRKYRQNLKGLLAKKYNWDLEAEKLLQFYEKLILPQTSS